MQYALQRKRFALARLYYKLYVPLFKIGRVGQ